MASQSAFARLRRAGAAAFIAATLMTGFAAAQEDTEFMSMRNLYRNATTERGDAVNIAMTRVDELLEKAPGDSVANVYKGSLLTMMGDDAMLPWNKLRYVNAGIDLMDEAVDGSAAAPDHGMEADAEILMVSGFTNARLPRMFKREAVARQQIAALIAHPAFSQMESDLQAQALAIAAAWAKGDGDAAQSDQLMQRADALDAAIARKTFNERS